MRVETPRGAKFRLTYGDDGSLGPAAVGLDRGQLDPALLALAETLGRRRPPRNARWPGRAADARRDGSVRIETSGSNGDVDGAERQLDARIVVGADGIRSVVARSLGAVDRRRSRAGSV